MMTVVVLVVVINVGMMIKVQNHVSEHPVMMVAVPADRVLDRRHSASHGCLHENNHQRDAKRCAKLFQGIGPGIHG